VNSYNGLVVWASTSVFARALRVILSADTLAKVSRNHEKGAFLSSTRRALGLGIAATAALVPLTAATSAQAAPADQHKTVQAKACGYDVCMYTGKKYTGKKWGYNHYGNKCATFDHATKIRSLKITSSRGTTFYSKKGCKGTASKSFAGHVSVPNYKFTARSGY
jgi:hypothetical protein